MRQTRKLSHALILATIEKMEPRQLLAAHIAGNATTYATIQAAVDAASAGATITVDAGTYPELVTITKTLTLKGARAGVDARTSTRGTNESIVRGQVLGSGDRSTGFLINANNVVLDGFTVQDDSSSNFYGAGVVLSPGVYGSRIVNNIIQHNVAGLYLANSSATVQAVIQYNVFTANNNAGLNSGRAIYSDGGVSGGNLTNVLIDGNTFNSNSGPVKIEAAIGLEAQTLGKQSKITITNNTFTNNGKAVLMVNVTDVTISRNTITGSTDVGSGAIRVEGGVSNVRITYNTIQTNKNAAIRIDNNITAAANSDIKINQNNFIANAEGGLKINAGAYVGTLDATNNYWGSATGPSGDAKGSGDAILANGVSVNFNPFSTALIVAPPVPNPPPVDPPPVTPPPVTPPPVVTPPPANGHHKHKKHKHLTKAQKARLHRLEALARKVKAALKAKKLKKLRAAAAAACVHA